MKCETNEYYCLSCQFDKTETRREFTHKKNVKGALSSNLDIT